MIILTTVFTQYEDVSGKSSLFSQWYENLSCILNIIVIIFYGEID